MQVNSLKRYYWVATIIFALLLIADGLGGVMQADAGMEVFVQLEYPMYLLQIIGIAKVLAGFAIVQTKWKTLKEWAFAGYAIDCVGATLSHMYSHSSAFEILLPFIFLAIASIPYFLWKKMEQHHVA